MLGGIRKKFATLTGRPEEESPSESSKDSAESETEATEKGKKSSTAGAGGSAKINVQTATREELISFLRKQQGLIKERSAALKEARIRLEATTSEKEELVGTLKISLQEQVQRCEILEKETIQAKEMLEKLEKENKVASDALQASKQREKEILRSEMSLVSTATSPVFFCGAIDAHGKEEEEKDDEKAERIPGIDVGIQSENHEEMRVASLSMDASTQEREKKKPVEGIEVGTQSDFDSLKDGEQERMEMEEEKRLEETVAKEVDRLVGIERVRLKEQKLEEEKEQQKDRQILLDIIERMKHEKEEDSKEKERMKNRISMLNKKLEAIFATVSSTAVHIKPVEVRDVKSRIVESLSSFESVLTDAMKDLSSECEKHSASMNAENTAQRKQLKLELAKMKKEHDVQSVKYEEYQKKIRDVLRQKSEEEREMASKFEARFSKVSQSLEESNIELRGLRESNEAMRILLLESAGVKEELARVRQLLEEKREMIEKQTLELGEERRKKEEMLRDHENEMALLQKKHEGELSKSETVSQGRFDDFREEMQSYRDRMRKQLEDRDKEILQLRDQLNALAARRSGTPGGSLGADVSDIGQEEDHLKMIGMIGVVESESFVENVDEKDKRKENVVVSGVEVSVQTDVMDGIGPEDAALMEFARLQAERDEEMKRLKSVLVSYQRDVRENEETIELLRTEQKLLKNEIRELERCRKREWANGEYLKNVFVKFLCGHMESPDASVEQHLLDVLGRLLQFSEQDWKAIEQARKQRVGWGGMLSRWVGKQ
eukprot:TRINITY_DN5911_c0_g2_i1.p1 TRINITY_DN5911_c0_g2~~TRINITY_DN5911_c0_g2_i1.p1  ORF type:complete len:778 (-),score=323.36 TRINITY_DN5911_c0_g2_i1:106-2439(-)